MKTCEQCGRTIPGSVDACPNCGYDPTHKNKNKKTLLIIIFSLLALIITVGITLTVLILNQKKPKTFDFDCAGYTKEMNALLDDGNKLDDDKWVPSDNKSDYTYSGSNYTIDLGIDGSSQKVKEITVSPSDSENGVKITAASMIVAGKDVTQDSAMSDLVKLKNGQDKVVYDDIIVSYDDENKEFIIEPNIDDNSDVITATTATFTEKATELPATNPPVTQIETTGEPTTEEPSAEAEKNWKKLYIDFLENECVFDYETAKLVYLNDDDIPELILAGTKKIQWQPTVVCWISGDEVNVFKTESGDIGSDETPSYTKRAGYYSVTKLGSFAATTWYYYFDGSSVTEVHDTFYQEPPDNFSPNNDEYKIDGQDVTKEEYNAFPDSLGSFEVILNRTDKSDLKSYIEEY